MKKRIVYIDILKILACALVILLHCTTSSWGATNPDSIRFLTQNLFATLARPCVNLFVMVTGALILSSTKEISITNSIKKALNFIVLVIIWSVFYMFTNNHELVFSGTFNYLQGLKQALTNPENHLWYLIMLAGLYLLMPFIQTIIKDSKKVTYLIVLFFVFDISVQLLADNLNINYFDYYIENISISFKYIGYLVLGYYLSTKEFSKVQKRIIYALGISSVCIIYVVVQILSVRTGEKITDLYSYFSMPTFFYSAALFVLVKNICNHLPDKEYKFLTMLSNCTFGIYLIHIAIMRLIIEYLFDIRDFPAILSIPSLFLLVFAISLLIVYVIQKIPYLKNIVSPSIFKSSKKCKK